VPRIDAGYRLLLSQTVGGKLDKCPDLCKDSNSRCCAGCYLGQAWGPCEGCSNTWCAECSKGTFKPVGVTWGEWAEWPRSNHFGYYQCDPCCHCNQDGYTTASTASTSPDACNICLPGYGRHEQSGRVPPCVCLPCPSGTFSGKRMAIGTPGILVSVTGPPKDDVYPLGFRYMNGCCTAVTVSICI
jgi:hypothetical protein